MDNPRIIYMICLRRRKAAESLVSNDANRNNLRGNSTSRGHVNSAYGLPDGSSMPTLSFDPLYDQVPLENVPSISSWTNPNESSSVDGKVINKDSFNRIAEVVKLVYGKGQQPAVYRASSVDREGTGSAKKLGKTNNPTDDANCVNYDAINKDNLRKEQGKCCPSVRNSSHNTRHHVEPEGYLVPTTLKKNDATVETLDAFLTDEEQSSSGADDFSSDEFSDDEDQPNDSHPVSRDADNDSHFTAYDAHHYFEPAGNVYEDLDGDGGHELPQSMRTTADEQTVPHQQLGDKEVFQGNEEVFYFDVPDDENIYEDYSFV